MELQEFSTEFDIHYNNILSNQAPGLTEYEKSVFLTQAQEDVVRGIYNGTLSNPFEKTEESRGYLDKLVTQQEITTPLTDGTHIIEGSKLYQLPEDYMFITYEGVTYSDNNPKCIKGKKALVKPITQDILWEMLKNPFKGPSSTRVLRLTYNDIAELIVKSNYNIATYLVRYIKRPKPIILESAPFITGTTTPEWTIDGEYEAMNCELHPNVHKVILEYAVQLAKKAWVAGNN